MQTASFSPAGATSVLTILSATAYPVGHTGPTGPGGPAGPMGPVCPSAPFSPSLPAGPVSPWGPAGPGSPSLPFAPGFPSFPAAPAGPCGPAGPAGPEQAFTRSRQPGLVPSFPAAPAGPCGPAGPAGPWGPGGPTRPASPWAPVAPAGPGGPGRSTISFAWGHSPAALSCFAVAPPFAHSVSTLPARSLDSATVAVVTWSLSWPCFASAVPPAAATISPSVTAAAMTPPIRPLCAGRIPRSSPGLAIPLVPPLPGAVR